MQRSPGVWAVQVVALTDRAAASRSRPASEREGLSGVPRVAAARRARPELQGAGRQVRGPRRGRAGRAAPQEGRTVPALDSALALLSGVLLALSFPKFGHPAFAWIALTPLIVALRALRRRRGRLAAPSSSASLTGAGYFSGTLYWLVETMTTFGGLARAGRASSPPALLVAYLSLFPAAFAVIAGAAADVAWRPRRGPAARRPSGSRRSWDGSTSGTVFRGRCSATAR